MQEPKVSVKHTLPEHMIAIPEESEDVDQTGISSNLLNNMGVTQGPPKNNLQNTRSVPMIGSKKIYAGNVISAASKNKNVVSIKPVRINK